MVRKRGRKPTYAAAEIEGSLAFWTQAEPVEIGHGTADFLTARGKQFRRIPPAASAGVVNTYCPEGINFAKPCPIPPDFIDAILRFHRGEIHRAPTLACQCRRPNHDRGAATELSSRTGPNALRMVSSARGKQSCSGTGDSLPTWRSPSLRFSQIDAISRNAPAPWRGTEKVDPGTSRHSTGISVTLAPSSIHLAISSMSNENPAARIRTAAARASGPEKNLKPHWVSVASATTVRARRRNTLAPAVRNTLCRASTTEQRCAREPITARWPVASRLMTRSNAERSVAMSASQNPMNGAWVASSPARTAAPLPRRAQFSSRTGTGSVGQFRTMSGVASVLALSTTRIDVRTGSAAAFLVSRLNPTGSRLASL